MKKRGKKSFLFLVAAFILVLNACSVEAKSLKKGEVYKSLSGDIIRTISANELELEKGRDIIVASYTVDGKTVRVVFTVLGTKRAQYYAIVSEGLKDKQDGMILYSRKQYKIAKLKAEEEKKKRKLAAKRERERKESQARLAHEKRERLINFSRQLRDVMLKL